MTVIIMNLNEISTQLLYVTVPIEVKNKDGSKELGTGFLVSQQNGKDPKSSIPLLITNWHVIKNANTINISMSAADENGMPIRTDPITAELNANDWIKHYDPDLDLALILMGPLFNKLSTLGKRFCYKTIPFDLFPNDKTIEELAALEEVVFI